LASKGINFRSISKTLNCIPYTIVKVYNYVLYIYMYIMIATLWFWSYPSSMAFCRGRIWCNSLTSAQLFDTPVVTRSRLDLVFPAMLTSTPAKIYRTGKSWAMSRAGFFSIAWPESIAANTCSGAYHWLTDASNIEPHHNSCAQRSVAVLCCLFFAMKHKQRLFT
jgi:hypothetical protein